MLLQSGKRGTERAWSIRRILLPLLVCMLAMVAGQGYAQEITEENEAQWVEAANQGNLEASYKLGCYYYDTALEFVDMFLEFEMGYYDGLIELDDLDELTGINENVWLYLLNEHTKAVIYWRGAAEKGHAESQYRMGEYAYSDFKIGDADYDTAANWFRKAAAQGHAKAKAKLEKLSGSTSSASTAQSKSTNTNTAISTSRMGTINGHEYVDLGLSVLWATCNVDAASPHEYGGHYAWAETSTKSSYTKENHRFYDGSKDVIMETAGEWIVGSKYDVAHVKWGSRWRMPTRTELAELFDESKCKREWMTYNGKEGFLITGPNGNSIFLPAASYNAYSTKEGYYRSGEDLHTFEFGKDKCKDVRYVKSMGCSIRPVASSYAGHESVDLGLSVKWATCNVGAYSPSHEGYCFEWGDTEVGTLETEVTYGKNIGSELSGNASYDAARVHWGGAWRLPTESEQSELVDKCTWTWTKLNGVSGYRVTGPNGNSIFLPYCDVIYAFYWSGSADSSIYSGYSIAFDENRISITSLNRNAGGRIRPVTD